MRGRGRGRGAARAASGSGWLRGGAARGWGSLAAGQELGEEAARERSWTGELERWGEEGRGGGRAALEVRAGGGARGRGSALVGGRGAGRDGADGATEGEPGSQGDGDGGPVAGGVQGGATEPQEDGVEAHRRGDRKEAAEGLEPKWLEPKWLATPQDWLRAVHPAATRPRLAPPLARPQTAVPPAARRGGAPRAAAVSRIVFGRKLGTLAHGRPPGAPRTPATPA